MSKHSRVVPFLWSALIIHLAGPPLAAQIAARQPTPTEVEAAAPAPVLPQAPPADANQPFGMTDEIGKQSLGTLEIDLHTVVALPLATLLGAALALRPRRRGTPKRSSQVVQTQIILSIIGALVMIVVGTSLARAFGVVGAAGLVRYRAKIDDPKDAGVMLTTLAVGLACGIGLYGLAMFATVFLVAVLWTIESFEPTARQEFILEVKAKTAAKLQPKIEALLRRHRVRYELREAKPEEFSYMVKMPMEVKTDTISAEIMKVDPDPRTEVQWKAERKREPEARMALIVEPEDGLTPVISAIKKAIREIDVTIFRFDLKELQKALESAVTRGVKVHALIAHLSGGGVKRLRKLELELLAAGVTVSRTDDDLIRYHNKMVLVDRETLYALAFNFTRLDIEKSRSMGVATKNKAVVAEAIKLFECDSTRKPYTANCDGFLVSPENARTGLAKFIRSAKKELLIYDIKVSDRQMIKLLQDRAKAGVDVRIIGKVGKRGEGLIVEKMPGMRLHVRAMLRDGKELFLGSMSLRALELDKRREVGVIVKERAAAKQFRELFEKDWAKTESGKKAPSSG